MKHGTLTKAELIEALKDYPDDMPVLIQSGLGWEGIHEVHTQDKITNGDEPKSKSKSKSKPFKAAVLS